MVLAAGGGGLVLFCPLCSSGVRMKPPQPTRASHGAGDIISASVWAFQHCWSPAFGNGGLFPTCGEISPLNCKYQPSGTGYGWCEALEDGESNRGVDEHGRVALPSQNICSVDFISAPVLNAGKCCLVHLLCWG